MKIFSFTTIFVVISAFCGFFGWHIRNMHFESNKSISDGRFSQLELALIMYHNENGNFPPVTYQRIPTEPIHSWRVLLLPYFTPDLQKSYAKYDFSKEWDSPENRNALGFNAPPFYRFEKSGAFSQYLTLNKDNKWPTRGAANCKIVFNGKDKFILIEYINSQIKWAYPSH